MRNAPQTTSMKRIAAALATTLLAGTAFAGPQPTVDGFRDTANVIASSPVYESVNAPQRDCWTEQVGYDRVNSGNSQRSYGGAIIGGLAGGLLGNTLGKGSGRSWATAIGAATGAIVGDNVDNDGHAYARAEPRPRYEQRCRTVDNWSRQITGYNVTYRYQGRDYTTFLPYDPGQTVRVRVNVSLAE